MAIKPKLGYDQRRGALPASLAREPYSYVDTAKEIFVSRLPHHPYCSNDKTARLIRARDNAAKNYSYIQHNRPSEISYITLDSDRPNSEFAWHEEKLLAPAFVSVDKDTGRNHTTWGIITPVVKTQAARLAPLRFAAAIEQAYCTRIGADTAYAGLITKNPLHDQWHTYFPASEAANFGYYTLNQLATGVDLSRKIEASKDQIAECGIGRNISLFDGLREWAYVAVCEYWSPGGFNAWQLAVINKAEGLNQFFAVPLPYSEIKATAKSVAKWVWQHITPAGRRDLIHRTHTSQMQSARGMKSGAVRAVKARENAVRARELQKLGISPAAIAKELCCGVSSVYRWLS